MLALTLFAGLALLSSRQAHALDAATWRARTSDTGVSYLACLVPACGGTDALVSFHPKPRNGLTSLAAFERYMKRVVEARTRLGLKTVRMSAASLGKAGLRHFRAVDTLGTPGSSEYFVSGYIDGPTGGFTIGSSAPSRADAERNYDMLVEMLRAGYTPPPARAVI